MKRSRKILFVCVGITVLLMIVNWREINSFLAHQHLVWFENVIDRQKTVMFRSGWVDSLYAKKKYSYYFFMKEGVDSEAIPKLPYDSVLAIKPVDYPLAFVNEGLDTISLPVSVLDIMLKENEQMALFQLVSAQKDNAGYLYRLKRIPVAK